MNWIPDKSWLLLTAMLLLATTTIVLGRGQATAPDPSFPAHAVHLWSVSVGHDDSGPAADRHHGNAPSHVSGAAGMLDGLPCNAACPFGYSGCVPAPVASHAGSLLHRDAGTVCIRHRDDLMLARLESDMQPKPPKPVA